MDEAGGVFWVCRLRRWLSVRPQPSQLGYPALIRALAHFGSFSSFSVPFFFDFQIWVLLQSNAAINLIL
jgi:hypothetical protein